MKKRPFLIMSFFYRMVILCTGVAWASSCIMYTSTLINLRQRVVLQKERVVYWQRKAARMHRHVDAWERNGDFMREACARRELGLARKDEELYLIS